MAKRKTGLLHCSFCGKSQKEIKKLIPGASDDVYICNRCVDICSKLNSDSKQRDAAAPATEEGGGEQKEKKKVPKRGAAGTGKKPAGQPGRTKSVHSVSSLIPKRSAI